MSESQNVEWKRRWRDEHRGTRQQLRGAALSRFLLRKQGLHWDGVPVPHARLEDLSEAAVDRFREEARRSGRLDAALLAEPTPALVDRLHLRERSHLKRAALLLFHPDPEVFFTGAYVKIGFFRDNVDLLYHDEIHGDLFAQVARTIDLLSTKYLRAGIRYEGIRRVESFPVPGNALREAVLNAVVHKDYASGATVQISVYDDKLLIWNPGHGGELRGGELVRCLEEIPLGTPAERVPNHRLALTGRHPASPITQANINRSPFGSGTGSPHSRAASIHRRIASLTSLSALPCVCPRHAARKLSCVCPCAMQPGSSGTSATNASSSSLQYRMISYLCITPPWPARTSTGSAEPAAPDTVWHGTPPLAPGGGRLARLRSHPGFDRQVRNALELGEVVGDQRHASGEGVGGDPEVVGADRLADVAQVGAEPAVQSRHLRVQLGYLHRSGEVTDGGEALRATTRPVRAVLQLAQDDYRHPAIRKRQPGIQATVPVHGVDADVRVEHYLQSKGSRSSSGSSSFRISTMISSKSSGNGVLFLK